MKKAKYILATITLFAVTLMNAQTTIGVKTGLNFSDAQAELYIDAVNNAPQSSTSFMVGAFTEIRINEFLSFQPELQYIKKGFSIDEGTSFNALGVDIPVGAKATTSINYLETPLLMKAKFGQGSLKFYGIAGPAVGYATSATIQPKVTLLIDFNLPEMELDLNQSIYNRTEISAIAGGGMEYNLATGKLFTDIRYQHSFDNIINDPIADISVRNKGIQFTVGYGYTF